MANSVDQDQTALFRVHAVCFYTSFVSNVRQLFAADDFSRRNFQRKKDTHIKTKTKTEKRQPTFSSTAIILSKIHIL